MSTWREELAEAIKTQSEREAEEAERQRKRLEEALKIADEATGLAGETLRFVKEQLVVKGQVATLEGAEGGLTLGLHGQSLAVELDRATAVLKVTANASRPREFDFAKDRHIAPKDVEEYVGRRAVELARSAQKVSPW
ncbi:MAG: hypothetical protein FJ095_16980 [Deltaproteobacteria bacterium]|nr:hypothetical protein [Deltaproteobacteria bacterium]